MNRRIGYQIIKLIQVSIRLKWCLLYQGEGQWVRTAKIHNLVYIFAVRLLEKLNVHFQCFSKHILWCLWIASGGSKPKMASILAWWLKMQTLVNLELSKRKPWSLGLTASCFICILTTGNGGCTFKGKGETGEREKKKKNLTKQAWRGTSCCRTVRLPLGYG